MDFQKYYEEYWLKRLRTQNEGVAPIRKSIPAFLVRFSSYGSVLNQVPQGSRVLDIGCGDGKVSVLYRKKGCKVTGIDISQDAIEQANKVGIQASQWNLNNLPLPFEDSRFDVVTIVDVLEHIENPLALLRECRRILVPTGRLIISTPNFARLGNRIRMLLGDPRDMLHWGGYGDGIEHLQWFTLPKLKYFIRQAGFDAIYAVPVGLPFGFVFGLLHLFGQSKVLVVVATSRSEKDSQKMASK